MSLDNDLIDRARRVVAAPVQTSDVFVTEASGHEVTGHDGRRYLDFAGGVGCLNLGHRHPAVMARLAAQLDATLHVGYSVVQYESYVEVCEKLVAEHPNAAPEQEYKAALFSVGVEAVEAAVKVARAATGRPGVVTLDRGFHGRSLLGASMSYKATPWRTSFGPMPPAVFHARSPSEYGGVSVADALESLDWLFTVEIDPREVAAVVYEPVQGEGGFNPLPAEYLEGVAERCRAHGIVLVADEIQSGMGRTGLPAAGARMPSVRPDVVCWGKSLGGGLPLSAITAPAALIDAVPAGGLASGTFGGNPLACAAATEVLDLVRSPEFQRTALAVGEHLRARLESLRAEYPDVIGDVRGVGPMQAIELVTDTASRAPATDLTRRVVARAREEGLIIKTCGPAGNVVRFLMPVTIPLDGLDAGLAILEKALAAVLAED